MLFEMQSARGKSLTLSILFGVGFLFVFRHATPYMLAATVTYYLLLLGYINRLERKIHVPLMLSGILGDLAIVLTLEFQRSAINTAMSFKLSPLQQSHIGLSTIATLLYLPVIYLGFVRLRSKTKTNQSLLWHKRLGMSALLFRTLGFITMFTLLSLYQTATV